MACRIAPGKLRSSERLGQETHDRHPSGTRTAKLRDRSSGRAYIKFFWINKLLPATSRRYQPSATVGAGLPMPGGVPPQARGTVCILELFLSITL